MITATLPASEAALLALASGQVGEMPPQAQVEAEHRVYHRLVSSSLNTELPRTIADLGVMARMMGSKEDPYFPIESAPQNEYILVYSADKEQWLAGTLTGAVPPEYTHWSPVPPVPEVHDG